eukprot:TRINITY_DN24683_c0_g1_i4.p2 TRINITY_DN24683_c0_g1~~TRINITY_DN24683_c0_g1_i4.p2  ORF type:complete len:191 (-),score=24.09 TRINITY_DN24683_c0_g1_i4:643-1215(-)
MGLNGEGVDKNSANSALLALKEANEALADQVLPDGCVYMDLKMDGKFYLFSAAVHASASCACVGASYMQRILRKNQQLAYLVITTPILEQEFGEWITPQQKLQLQQEIGQHSKLPVNKFYEYMFMCIYIASKLTDPLLTSLYTSVLSMLRGKEVDFEEALSLELHCLNELDWRLGPFYNQGKNHNANANA